MALVARLEIALDLAAAAGAAGYVAVVARAGDRVRASLSALLVALGVGFGCRGVAASTGAAWAVHLQYLGFGSFPIAALVYAEAVTGRTSPLALKLVALAATAWFALSWPTALVAAPGWTLGMMAYQLVVLAFLGVRFAGAARRTPIGPRRSALVALAVVAAAAFVGVVSENRDVVGAIGLRVPRVGGLGLLLVTFAASCSFHAGGLWRLRGMALRLIVALALAVSFATALVVLVPSAPRDVGAWAVTLPVLAFLVLDPVRLAIAGGAPVQAGALLERVTRLRAADRDATIAELRAWPELRRVELLELAWLAEHGYDEVAAHVASTGGPVARLARAAVSSASRPVEQAHDLLERRRADFLLPAPGGAVLSIAIDGFLDREAFRLVLHPLCRAEVVG